MSLEKLNSSITACQQCRRLREYCGKIAKEKRAAYSGETYWGKPVPSFGDPRAELVIVGLAPAAHGANRTGRMFTGDRSGEWLYRALHKAGFANQPHSTYANDGLLLQNAWISAIAHCAPPDNKPLPEEIQKCSAFLEKEIQLMPQAKVYLALGQIALTNLWPHISSEDEKRPKFAHGLEQKLASGKLLLLSYHPSQQNTFTKRLTEPMFDSIFRRAKEWITS